MPTEQELRKRIHGLFSPGHTCPAYILERHSWWKAPDAGFKNKARHVMDGLDALETEVASALHLSEEIENVGHKSSASPELPEQKWLLEPNSMLGGNTPEEMLIGSEQDRQKLLAAITALQQGAFK